MKTLMRRLVSLIIGRGYTQRHGMILALSVISAPLAAAAELKPYTFGAFPHFSPSRLEEMYAPVAAEISRAIERDVYFRTALNFDKFYLQLKAQTYDLIMIPPLYYVPAVDEFGYLPLARVRERFKAIIVVPDRSAIRDVAGLQGKIIATPPAYTLATRLAKQVLRDQGLIDGENVTYKEMKTPESCLQQALTGSAQACIAASFVVLAFQKSAGVTMRTVLEAASLPNFLIAAHKRVPASDRNRIKATILGLQDTPTGKVVLKSLNTQGFIEATDADYEPVRVFMRALKKPWLPSVP